MFNDVSTNNTLSKILDAKPVFNPKNFLSNADIEFCNSQENLYSTLLENFEFNLKLINQMEDLTNEVITVGCNSEYITHNFNNTTWATYLYYSPKRGIIYINKARKLARTAFIESIQKYLEKTYNVKFPDQFINHIPKEQHPTANIIIKALMQSLNFVNLNSEGENKLKNEFNRVLVGWKGGVQNSKLFKFSGRRLSIDNCIYFQSYTLGYQIYNIEDRLKTIIRALSFFENGSLDMLNLFTSNIPTHTPIDFKATYEFPVSEKVDGVKFFKNGRIDVLFSSHEDLMKFIAEFKIDV